MSAEQIQMEALLNDYAYQTAMHFNAFGYVAVTPDEVKNVFSWQRETQITFDSISKNTHRFCVFEYAQVLRM